MIAVDTNILIYAHRQDSPWHQKAFQCIKGLAEADKIWTIPWPCIHEFLSICTHPRIFNPPSTIEQALEQVEQWFKSPSLKPIGESDSYWDHLKTAALRGKIVGPKIHDLRIATICSNANVLELWTADRDFSKFKMNTQNPLL